jgi:hypothetical protein
MYTPVPMPTRTIIPLPIREMTSPSTSPSNQSLIRLVSTVNEPVTEADVTRCTTARMV